VAGSLVDEAGLDVDRARQAAAREGHGRERVDQHDPVAGLDAAAELLAFDRPEPGHADSLPVRP
jgi:hypothetical protein